MDQVKIGIAMAVVAAIILWVAGAYALEAWQEYRARRRARSAAPIGQPDQAAAHGDDRPMLPPAAAA